MAKIRARTDTTTIKSDWAKGRKGAKMQCAI